jgi:hypothetical protein
LTRRPYSTRIAASVNQPGAPVFGQVKGGITQVLSRFKRLPSPALLISVIALSAAIGGVAVALPGHNSVKSDDIKNGQVKSPDLKNNGIKGTDVLESSLGAVPNANHANSAASATNAAQLGGHAASDYLRAGSRGVALAGVRVSTAGNVRTWFNTRGGTPTVSHTPGEYLVTFPGLTDTTQSIPSATLDAAIGEISATGEGTDIRVNTYNSAGNLVNGAAFFLVVYGASSSG